MKKTLHIIVKGRVQGVGYRWFAKERARECNITGFVRNLYNGDVEVVAQGEENDLSRFLEELNRGPAFAHVVEMQVDEIEIDQNKYSSFEIAF